MTFFIQASSPAVVAEVDASEDDLREAIEDVFEFETEDAILNWNGVSVVVSYKYDISVMVDDLVDMLLAVQSTSVGSLVVTWPSNTFQATWHITWDERGLACTATWNSVSGGVEDVLSKTGDINLSRGAFLAEWKAPLERVVSALRRAGYSARELPRLEQIEQILAHLVQPGRLYR